MQGRASIENILPTMQQARDVALLTLMVFLVVVIWTSRKQINAWALWFIDRYFTRYVASDELPTAQPIAVSPHQDAVKENAESGKTIHLTPAELDKMLADARHETTARAVGTLAGAGINPATHRAKALIRLGIEGRRYQALKQIVDQAQTAAQMERGEDEPAAPPRVVKVYEGRPGEREIELTMEPAP